MAAGLMTIPMEHSRYWISISRELEAWTEAMPRRGEPQPWIEQRCCDWIIKQFIKRIGRIN